MARNPFAISVQFSSAELQLWRTRFDAVAQDSFPRALQWSLNEIAKDAVMGFRSGVGSVLDRPKDWTVRGVRYRRVDLEQVRRGRKPYSETYVLPKQSAVLKYLMGDSEQVRFPGDVGPSQAYIAMPKWANLRQYANVNRDSFGNLPSSTMRRIRRHSNVQSGQATPNPRGTTNPMGRRSQFFFGEPMMPSGRGHLGFYYRPRRIKQNGRWVNQGAPKLVIHALDYQRHKPILQPFWEDNAQRAASRLPALLRAELREKIRWVRSRRR